MKFYKFVITLWRDRAAARRSARIATELAEIDAKVGVVEKLAADERERVHRLAGSADQVQALQRRRDDLIEQRQAIVGPEETLAGVLLAAAGLHPMVGKLGYQVISADGSEVIRVVDAEGNEFPANAVVEYDLLEIDAPAPDWAPAKLAEWFPPKRAGEVTI